VRETSALVLILVVNIVASKYKVFKRAVGISDLIIPRLAGSIQIYTFHEYIITGIDKGANSLFFRKSKSPDNDQTQLCYIAAQYMRN
jgi:hypothetical protein